MLDQVENARAIYGAIPNDDILQGFRRNAGLPAPGNGMRGWCKDTSGVIFGQLLSGMVRMGRGLGDGALIEKAVLLMEGWAKTLPAGRRFRHALLRVRKARLRPGRSVSVRRRRCGAAAAGARDRRGRRNTSTARARAPTNHRFQGGADRGTREWYTLPENLYRAYLLTGRELYRQFADEWLYHDYWALFAATSEPNEVIPVHAYSHVNSFNSAAMAYAVTGDDALPAHLHQRI